ncbi:Hypothetical predicted protein, partial [Scomber scombrus]
GQTADDVGDADTLSSRKEEWRQDRILPPSLITGEKEGDSDVDAKGGKDRERERQHEESGVEESSRADNYQQETRVLLGHNGAGGQSDLVSCRRTMDHWRQHICKYARTHACLHT